MMAFTTRCLRNISLLLWLMACPMIAAQAETIVAQRAKAEVTADGQLALSSRFQVKLPPALSDVLEQGVTLPFRLEFQLTRPRTTAYYLNVKEWFEPHARLDFKLSYQSLTRRYRVTIGGLANYYSSLREALAAIGAIQGWQVLPLKTLNPLKADGVAGEIRLILDIGELPKPFQLNALGSDDWSLSSDWIKLEMKDGT
ncbi:DUF4390 domain-containing protein [Neisseriaceae bacterium TC5R-5]|nr:DUF4390 domain-containing protein [Neisseriaceae bacterium TC5R-5]